MNYAKQFGDYDSSNDSSDCSNQSPKTTDFGYGANTSSNNTASSAAAFGTGNISLCQAVFAPQSVLDNLNEQNSSKSGIINMVIVISNLRGELSVLMNQTSKD